MLKKLASIFKPRDMTGGNLFAKIILLAVPAMLATMMQLLYTTIDLATVSAGDGAESMGAIASNTALINLIIVVFTGTALGANVVLSEAKGADNKEKAHKSGHISILNLFYYFYATNPRNSGCELSLFCLVSSYAFLRLSNSAYAIASIHFCCASKQS